jgi:hypothetical protein
MGSSRGSSTTTVRRLPAYCEPYVTSFLSRASDLSNVAYSPYGGPTYATQNADELDGISRMATRGRSGNATITKGGALILDILDGDYLPGTDTLFQNTLTKVHDSLATSFVDQILPLIGAKSMLVGDLSGENVAQNLCAGTVAKLSARVQAALHGRNYRTGRIDQHQALEFGPEYASQPYRDAETLRTAGLYAREYLQGSYTDTYHKWTDDQIARVQRLELLGNAIRAMVGNQYTKTEPYYKPSPVVGMMGGALSGAAAGALLGGKTLNPYLVVGGAVAGAVLGYLSSE